MMTAFVGSSACTVVRMSSMNSARFSWRHRAHARNTGLFTFTAAGGT